MKRLLLLIAFFAVAIPAAWSDERILNYHSEILIKTDGWIEVIETIVVRAEGRQIRRGIFRDYPTRYRDRTGNDVEVLYRPRAVLRNDRAEDFSSEKRNNGVRTYFGSADRMLDHGIHTYTFRYDAGRMLGFFDDYDELYDQAVALVAEIRQASISMLQRKMRVGYKRAARMIERMEKEGVVGVSDGVRPREVLINKL